MNAYHFPFVATVLGIILLPVVVRGSAPVGDGATLLPLLTLLLISEFAFLVTAVGAYLGFKQVQTAGLEFKSATATVICGLLSVVFLFLGFKLWPL
jgi:hypothetical protein